MAVRRRSGHSLESVLLISAAELDGLAEESNIEEPMAEKLNDPLEDLIATAEATYEFIRSADMDPALKRAFYQLERKFELHKKLVELGNS